jgi:hypothetical protein
MNIAYNWNAVVTGLLPGAQEAFRDVQLLVVNVIVYSLGLGLLFCLAHPVCRALIAAQGGKRREKNSPSSRDRQAPRPKLQASVARLSSEAGAASTTRKPPKLAASATTGRGCSGGACGWESMRP